jgi:putative peptidoglycan lipid II flippase
VSHSEPTRPPIDAPAIDAPLADGPLSEALVEPAVISTADATPAGRQNMLRSSMIYSGMTLISRLMGFLRDLAITYTMGASAAADAYNTALMFPNVFRRIFAEGAFAAAFVPAYSKALARDGEEKADILAADAMAVLTTATLGIMLVAELTMTWLMYVISPGFVHNPGKFALAVWLTRITMPYLPCMAVYAHLSGVLNARGRFIISGFAPTLLNLVMLIAVLPQKNAHAAAFAASWGVLIAGVLQAALLWWGVKQSGGHVGFRWPRLTPEIKALIGLAIPGAIAASATQINIVISNVLASQVNGARSWLAVADRLYQLPLGLVGVAVGVALLPRLSTAVHSGNRQGEREAMDEAITFALALTLPAAAALIAMPYFLIDGLFTRGEFHQIHAIATARALFYYGWGTPAFVLQRILTPAFFARGDTKSPMRFALISVAVNIVCGIGFFYGLRQVESGVSAGVEGIAAATALASWVNVFQMVTTLVRRGYYLPGRAVLVRIVKILGASAVMAVLMGLASALRPHYEHFLLSKAIAVVLVAGLGAVVYFALLFVFRAVTPAEIRGAFKRQPKAKGVETGPELM